MCFRDALQIVIILVINDQFQQMKRLKEICLYLCFWFFCSVDQIGLQPETFCINLHDHTTFRVVCQFEGYTFCFMKHCFPIEAGKNTNLTVVISTSLIFVLLFLSGFYNALSFYLTDQAVNNCYKSPTENKDSENHDNLV